MFVAFCDVEPNTQSHQAPGHKQLNGDRLSNTENSNDHPKASWMDSISRPGHAGRWIGRLAPE